MRLAGYTAQLSAYRDTMGRDASKAAKAETKLKKLLGGYQARSAALTKRVADGFAELQRTKLEYASFAQLRTNEGVIGSIRLDAVKDEVDRLERRERMLQERHAELDGEKREMDGRITTLEAWCVFAPAFRSFKVSLSHAVCRPVARRRPFTRSSRALHIW